MGILHTPREVLAEINNAAAIDPKTPAAGLGFMRAIETNLGARGLLDMKMTAGSVDALLKEAADQILKPEAEIDPNLNRSSFNRV